MWRLNTANTLMEIQEKEKKKKSEIMNSKQSSIRAKGQLTINSTLIFRDSKGSGDCNKNVETRKCSHLSLSEFLNKKLHKSSVVPTSAKGKEVAFSSPLSGQDLDKSTEGQSKAIVSLDGVFQMFKNVEKDQTNFHANAETESLGLNDSLQSRKRKTLVDGSDHKPSAPKLLAVLGDDSKPTRTKRRKNFGSKEVEYKPLFNHYKSGRGWWDENMEGVDNEEVGCNEAWEGVGRTTLGGMEWH